MSTDDQISPDLQAEIDDLLKNPPGEEDQKKLDAMERRQARVKTFGKGAGKPKVDRTVTMSFRVNTKVEQQLHYWADKRELTLTEYITDAIREKIARENGDFDLPNIMVGRIAELVDSNNTMAVSFANMEKSFSSMMEFIAVMSRDPKYMISEMKEAIDE